MLCATTEGDNEDRNGAPLFLVLHPECQLYPEAGFSLMAAKQPHNAIPTLWQNVGSGDVSCLHMSKSSSCAGLFIFHTHYYVASYLDTKLLLQKKHSCGGLNMLDPGTNRWRGLVGGSVSLGHGVEL